MPTPMTLSAIVGLLEWLAAQRQAARIAGKSMGGEMHRVAWGQARGLGEDGDFSWRLMTFFTFTGTRFPEQSTLWIL